MIYEQDSDGDDCWLEIKTPTVTSPLDGATGIAVVTGLTISVSAFVPQIPGLTLASTDIEVRTGANGTGTMVWSSSSALIIPALTLSLGTTYYIRVRHRTSSFTSMWSTDVRITTIL